MNAKDFLNERMEPPANSRLDLPTSIKFPDSAYLYGTLMSQPRPEPDYTEQLDKLGHSSDAANAELRAVNVRFEELQSQLAVSNTALSEAEKEIKTLNATTEKLRQELDEECKRAAKAEKKAQIIAFVIAIIGAVLSGAASVFFALYCAKGV